MTDPQHAIVTDVDPTVKRAGGAQGAIRPGSPRVVDPVFELLYTAQTLEPYTPDARITAGERGKINRASKEVRDAGFTADDLILGLRGWPAAMGGARITAIGLAANLTRCINAARGATSARREMTDVERALEAYARRGTGGT